MTQLIFAADFSDKSYGVNMIRQVAPHIDGVKIGLEAMTALDETGCPIAYAFERAARFHDLRVMWDIKLHDIANTMGAVARNLCTQGVGFFTLHSTASDAALEAVAAICNGTKTIPLAVTVLTDIDDMECIKRYGGQTEDTVRDFAWTAYKRGIRGLVCSPHEVRDIKEDGKLREMYCVVPGIRPTRYATPDEQARIMTPAMAKKAGADAIVVGRPISKPTGGLSPAQAAEHIRDELTAA